MEWAPPDPPTSAPATPTAEAPAAVATPPLGLPSSARTTPRQLPKLVPMTVSDILDGGFAILKAAPATIIGFTAIFVIPVQILAGWLQRDLFGSGSFFDVFEDSDTSLMVAESSDDGTWATLLLLFGPSLALVFIAAGIARLVGAWYAGNDLSIGDLLRGSLPMAWPLLASWFLVHLAESIGSVACFLPALAAMTWFLVVAPVIGAEGLGPIAAMRRSARLTSRRFWPVMGLALLSGMVAYLFSQALGVLPQVLALFVGLEDFGWVLLAVGGIITSLITMPFTAAATVLIYLDLRVRTEGLDLEMDAREAFAAEHLR